MRRTIVPLHVSSEAQAGPDRQGRQSRRWAQASREPSQNGVSPRSLVTFAAAVRRSEAEVTVDPRHHLSRVARHIEMGAKSTVLMRSKRAAEDLRPRM